MKHSIHRARRPPQQEERPFWTGSPNTSNTCRRNETTCRPTTPTTMRSRRLDYVSTSRKVLTHTQPIPESKDLASSDHEAVAATLTTKATNSQPQQKLTHHPMKLKALGAKLPGPPLAAHPWDSLTALAMQVTEAYPKPRFQESGQLKQHRHKLVSGQIPQDQQRQHWRLIQAAHKREKKRWDHAQAIKAAKGGWQAYRQSKEKPQQMQWGHRLILKQDWQKQMVSHFQSIFKQQPSQRVNAEIGAMRQLLERRCKETPCKLVQEQELRDIQAKWRNKKATGPDRVSSEALSFFLSHSSTASKLIWTLDDALYKGTSPTRDLQDMTVLLPKTDRPMMWKDTRPITLSNTIDRTGAAPPTQMQPHTTAAATDTPIRAVGQTSKRTPYHHQENGEDVQRLGF